MSTKFGSIPLGDSDNETIGSARHSRMSLHGDLKTGPVQFTGYLESDFMNFTPSQSPYRWRQYWAQARYGKWELLGGQAWSMLRPNRKGIATESDMLNTDVIEPAYHVGLVGSRRRQLRLTRTEGNYTMAVAWEANGNWVFKVARESGKIHLEAGGFSGRSDRRGGFLAQVVPLSPKLRIVGQQFSASRGADEALGIAPKFDSGMSAIEGVEAQITKNLELYSYAGFVYAKRAPGNRAVNEYSLGFNRRVPAPGMWGSMLFSLQYSHFNRATWLDRVGHMDYVMYRVRYVIN
ncbi:MAG: hypothetical protein ABI972_17225 [Acidobacteriota bacterium]